MSCDAVLAERNAIMPPANHMNIYSFNHISMKTNCISKHTVTISSDASVSFLLTVTSCAF